MYAFKGFDYYVLNEHGKSKGPKRVTDHWKELTTEVNAAYTRNDGKSVFFSSYRWVQLYYFREKKYCSYIHNKI